MNLVSQIYPASKVNAPIGPIYGREIKSTCPHCKQHVEAFAAEECSDEIAAQLLSMVACPPCAGAISRLKKAEEVVSETRALLFRISQKIKKLEKEEEAARSSHARDQIGRELTAQYTKRDQVAGGLKVATASLVAISETVEERRA